MTVLVCRRTVVLLAPTGLGWQPQSPAFGSWAAKLLFLERIAAMNRAAWSTTKPPEGGTLTGREPDNAADHAERRPARVPRLRGKARFMESGVSLSERIGPMSPVGTRSTASPFCCAESGTEWNRSLPGSWGASTFQRTRFGSMNQMLNHEGREDHRGRANRNLRAHRAVRGGCFAGSWGGGCSCAHALEP